MRRHRVGQDLLRQLAPAMRTRNHADGAVLRREIMQQPDRVAPPVAESVRDSARVAMERLYPVGVWIGRARVKAAEFEVRSQDVSYALENPRHRDHVLENLTPVHQACQPPCLRFFLEFGTVAVSFLNEDFLDAASNRVEQLLRHEVFEHEISVLVETALLNFVHGVSLGLSGFWSLLSHSPSTSSGPWNASQRVVLNLAAAPECAYAARTTRSSRST